MLSTMKRILLILLLLLFIIKTAISQVSENNFHLLFNNSFKNKVELVYNEYIKDAGINQKIFIIDYWNFRENYFDINDTDYFSIQAIEKLSHICFRIPITYLIKDDNIFLINTGLEDKIKPNPEYLKTLFLLLNGKIENNVIINSYDDFEYTVLFHENHDTQLDGGYTVNSYYIKKGQIVKEILGVGGLHYSQLMYKYHRKFIE
jgi:hypothetical protein